MTEFGSNRKSRLKQANASAGAKIITNPEQPQLSLDATEATSDTGELKRNWASEIYTIDTPCTQATMGRIAQHKLALSDVVINIANKNATVAVQSLDGKPISLSKRIYITVKAQTWIDPKDTDYFYAEPVSAILEIKAPEGLKLIAAGKNNLPIQYSDGHYLLNLEGAQAAYLLTEVAK